MTTEAAIVIQIMVYIVESRLSAAQAASRAAAEFDYFQRVSEAELSAVSRELATQYPTLQEWQWYNLLTNLKKYGIWREVEPGPGSGEREDNKTHVLWYALAGAGVLAVALLLEET